MLVGVVALADAIRNNGPMTSLNISSNFLTNKGIKLLCDAVESNAQCAIRHLDITCNNLSDPAANFLVKGLPHGVQLEWESGNQFTDRGKLQLQRWIEHGKLIETGTAPLANFKLHLCGDQGAAAGSLRSLCVMSRCLMAH